MNANLLENLLAKLGGIPGKFRAAKLGGDEAMAGAKKAFRTGRQAGPDYMSAGGKSTAAPEMSDLTALELGRASSGPLGEAAKIGPFDNIEKLKMMLKNLSPQQKAALLAGTGGLGAGGLGGYMMGDEE
jgi:subtilisin family serine protease